MCIRCRARDHVVRAMWLAGYPFPLHKPQARRRQALGSHACAYRDRSKTSTRNLPAFETTTMPVKKGWFFDISRALVELAVIAWRRSK